MQGEIAIWLIFARSLAHPLWLERLHFRWSLQTEFARARADTHESPLALGSPFCGFFLAVKRKTRVGRRDGCIAIDKRTGQLRAAG